MTARGTRQPAKSQTIGTARGARHKRDEPGKTDRRDGHKAASRATRIDVAKLWGQIAVAVEAELTKVFSSANADKDARAQYGPEIREQFAVDVDCPELTWITTEGRIARLSRRFDAQLSIAREYATLLASQAERRRRFWTSHGLPPATAPNPPMEGAFTAGHAFDLEVFYRLQGRLDATSEDLMALLQHLATDPAFATRRNRLPHRRVGDVALIRTAGALADWTRLHGRTGKADWKAVAKILRCHGVDLREAFGTSSLERQAQCLEDRVRKAPKTMRATAP
jgi:hypothetical protein